MDPFGQWLWYANLAAAAVLIARIVFSGSYRTYPSLLVYFLVFLGGGVILTQLPFHSNSFALTYMGHEFSLHVIAIVAAMEMYRVALARHKGLANFGRTSVLIVALGVTIVAVTGALLDKNILSGQSVILHRFLTLERTLEFITFMFLLLIAIFITWFPVERPSNVALSIGGFSVYYVTRAATLLAANLLPPAYLMTVNHALLASSFCVLTIWAFLLRRDLVDGNDPVGSGGGPAALDRAGRQLDAINSALVRFGRR